MGILLAHETSTGETLTMNASSTMDGLRRLAGFAALMTACACIHAWGGQSEVYRLVAGDVVAVQVLYHPDFGVERATVRPDGRINVPVAGEVIVAGRTVEEVAGEIATALAEELREPRVSVRLVERYVKPVYVLGAVRAPGAVQVVVVADIRTTTVAAARAVTGLAEEHGGKVAGLVVTGARRSSADYIAAGTRA
jgi:protein involved in polysaccharide export with SLBB domain